MRLYLNASAFCTVRLTCFGAQAPAAASIFDDVVGAMASAAAKWDFQADIVQVHDLGRALAVSFYARSPHAITQARCQRICPLNWDYGEPGEDETWPISSQLLFGYHTAPIAFRPKSDDIVVRFTLHND